MNSPSLRPPSHTAAGPSADEELARVLDGYLADLEAGRAPDPEQLLAEHPTIAERLRACLAGLDFLEKASESFPQTDREEKSEVVGEELGDFRLLREIGRGGMGVVYEAEQRSLGRRVAVKLLPFAGALDPRQLQRFKNEAQAAAQLHHTNIVPVHFVGSERGVHYYAMQLIDGCTLAEVIRELRQGAGLDPKPEPHQAQESKSLELLFGPIPREQAAPADQQPTTPYVVASPSSRNETPKAAGLSTERSHKDASYFRTVAELGIQAAEALEHAHLVGVVHRDIKPGNLLLDQRGNLWVTDFGLAQFQSGTDLTMTGDLLGTLRYMSPEQALAQRVIVDQRTDIYSLGATLYELLTLQAPFGGKDRQELLRQIAFEEPRSLRRLNKAIPEELEIIVLKSMEKNAAARYGAAREMAEDLRRWLEHKPIFARRPGLVQRSRKWAQRHPSFTASALVILVLAVAGLLISTLLIGRANHDKGLALEAAEQAKTAAQESDAESKAVLEFVEKRILASARPKDQDGGLGHDVKLAEAIKAALPFVDNSFRDHPRLEAKLRSTIGLSLIYLGDYDAAARQFEAVRQFYTDDVGADHPDALNSMNQLGNCYHFAGHSKEALEVRKETLRRRKAILGPDHPDTLRSMNNLSVSYHSVGRDHDAITLLEETLALQKAKLGVQHPDTMNTMHNLALSYGAVGRIQDALELDEKTLQLRKKLLPANHPDTLKSMNNLAVRYKKVGRAEDALKLDKETLALRRRVLPSDHPNTLMSMMNLAHDYYDVGRFQDALELCEEVLHVREAKLGRAHSETLKTMKELAFYYRSVGRIHEGNRLTEATLQLSRVHLGRDHLFTLEAMGDLAGGYFLAGRVQEALKLNEEGLSLKQAKLGPAHRETLGTMLNLANCYIEVGRGQEALKLREETFQLCKTTLGRDHRDTLMSMHNLANSYDTAGRVRDALQLREEMLSLSKAKLGPDHPDSLRCMSAMSGSYMEVGEVGKAETMLRDVLTIRQRRVRSDPENPTEQCCLAVTHREVGNCDAARLNYAAAVQSFAKSVEIFEKLDRAKALQDQFFRVKLGEARQLLARCRKAERAVNSLDFALQQPAAEIPGLLDIRIRYFLKEENLPVAVESAAKFKERAGAKADDLYNAACVYALCAAAAKQAKAPVVGIPGFERLADQAMALLKQAVAKGFKDAGHMKEDTDLESLRDRADFQKLIADLESAKKS
jgi:eukaryotic-like serine/threonine-protein kinase